MTKELETEGQRYVILPFLSHTEVFTAFDLAHGPKLNADHLMRVVRTHLLAFDAVLLTPGALTQCSTENHEVILSELLENREFNIFVDEGLIGTFHDGGDFNDFKTYANELVELGGRLTSRRLDLARKVFGRMRYLPRSLRKQPATFDAISSKYVNLRLPVARRDLIERVVDRATHPDLGFSQESLFIKLREGGLAPDEMQFLAALMIFRSFAGPGRPGVYSYPTVQLLRMVERIEELGGIYGGPHFHPVFHPATTQALVESRTGSNELNRYLGAPTAAFVRSTHELRCDVDRGAVFFDLFDIVRKKEVQRSALIELHDDPAMRSDASGRSLDQVVVEMDSQVKAAQAKISLVGQNILPVLGSKITSLLTSDVWSKPTRRGLGGYALRFGGGTRGHEWLKLLGIIRACC